MSQDQFSLPDRYRMMGHVASGGMAAVFAAHDELLRRDVAVKVLAEHLNSDDGAKVRFQREARAAAGLSSHPHVVTIYDVGEHHGRSFIVMELLSRGSLAALLRSGEPVSRETAVRWLRDAASALDAAHEAGIVHRDIKPANLLLDDRGGIAIADFGIARVAQEDGNTMTGQVLGTAAYLSPEQALGETATAASDHYALAVVAFELIAGSRPFKAEHFAAQARAHIEDSPPRATDLRPELPGAVDAVMDRGLAKDPADRWPSAAAFVDAIDRAVSVPEPEATRQMPAQPRRAVAAPVPVAAPPRRREPPPPAAGDAWDEPPARRDDARGPSRTGLLVGALLAALVIAGVVLATTLGGGEEPNRQAEATPTPTATATATPEPTPEATATPEATPEATATPEPTPEATETPGETPSGDASSLNNRGFALYQAGDYAGAVPLLQGAVDQCGDRTTQDPCAFALFNLGSALHRSGKSAEGIPFLERRLEISNFKSGVVKKELAAARKAAG